MRDPPRPIHIWIAFEAHTHRCNKCYEGDSRSPSFYCQSYIKLGAQWLQTNIVENLNDHEPFGIPGYDELNRYINSPEFR